MADQQKIQHQATHNGFSLPKPTHKVWQFSKIKNDTPHVVSVDGLTRRYHSILRRQGEKARIDVEGKHHLVVEHVVENGHHALKVSSPKGKNNAAQTLPIPSDGHTQVDIHVTKDGKYRLSAGTNHVEGHLETMTANDPNAALVTADVSTFHVDQANYQIMQSNDFAQIQAMRDKSNADLNPVLQNISQNGQNAFAEVSSGGQTYYVSYNNVASVYSWAQEVPTDDPYKKAYRVQLGSYSSNAGILGISHYVLTNLPITITAGVVSLIFTKLAQGIISEGLGYAAAYVTTRLAIFLAEAGWEAAAVEIPVAWITFASTLVATGVGILVFLAIAWLATWMFRVYNLVVEIDNYDMNNDWGTGLTIYTDNATLGGGATYGPLKAPKVVPPGSSVTPPGFQPITNLEGIISYMVYVYQNDSTFFQGLGISGSVANQTTNQGFNFMYDLPRFGDNYIGVNDGIIDNKSYYQNGPKAQKKTFNITSQGLPIVANTDYLSGAPNQTYNLLINIGTLPSTNIHS